MPKLSKRCNSSVDVENQSSPSAQLSRTQRFLSRMQFGPSPAPYRHFAGSIRCPRHVDQIPDDASLTRLKSLLPTNKALTITILIMLLCLAVSPSKSLRILLLAEMYLCNFPPFFTNWVILIPVLMPMHTMSLLEIVLGVAMFSWLSKLEWVYAWARIIDWATHV